MTKRGAEWESHVRAEASLIEGSGEGTRAGENPVKGWRMRSVTAIVERRSLSLFETGVADRQTVESRNLCLYLLRLGRSPVERATIFAWFDVGDLCAVDRAESRSVKGLFWLKEIEQVRITASTVRALDFALRVRPGAEALVVRRMLPKGQANRDLWERMQARARAVDRAGRPSRQLRLA